MEHSRRYIHVAAAVVIMATAFAMSGSLRGVGAMVTTEIDLTGPVSATTCSACHARIADSRNPGLIFSHGTHIMVDCAGCHVRPAHEAGHTYGPPMETCFACHGLVHGAGGVVAADSCDYCHTALFELRPAYHTPDWVETPHARAVERGGSNQCIMCHDARAECDTCHREEGIETPRVPPIFLRTVPEPEPRPSVVIDTEGPATMGQCVFCHPDIERGEWNGVIFTHDVHIARDYRCAVCHETFAHQPDHIDRPDMLSCYRCHSLEHAERGEVATEECLACHPADFELVPADHTVEFIARDHREPAEENLIECVMCHASIFCAECHRGEKELADGTMSAEVIPDDHRRVEWMAEHGAPYLGGQGGCSICHTNESCTRCHETAMPHPTVWLATHTSNGYSRDDCKVCHTDRTACQECHHDSVRDVELLAENCVSCHPEMATEPATDIKVMGLVEHAVHFDVVERVGRPYRCDDCHIGLTVARVRGVGQHAFETQAHDLRICYDCHGNLDFRNVQIAPWPGSQLCRRCHTDLNI